ncbi:MAG: hypothetical protein IPP59_12870 [Betaproteobacteria bacterium]|jgi:hypothetical protein|nr:hypothetical protein [Candidatus Dechloromonas phosphorivorans]
MIDTNLPRRPVLRPALASGCSRWTPIAKAAADKLPQRDVQYQATPRSCGFCLNCIAGANACKVVEGRISPEGWCSVWVARA